MDLVAGDLHIGAGAKVILHIARATGIVRIAGIALEFRKHLREGLLHDIDQHIQSATMRHADGDFLGTVLGCGFNHRLHRRNGRLPAFQAEALGAHEFPRTKGFKAFRFRQLLQDLILLRGIKSAIPGRAFNAALDPGFLVRILDMHELHADRTAIGSAADGEDFTQARGFLAQHEIKENLAIPILLRETIGLGVKLRMGFGHLQAERIKPRFQMPTHAIAADQHQRADRIEHCAARRFRVCGTWLGALGGGGLFRFRPESAPDARRPGCARGIGQYRAGLIIQRSEKLRKARVHTTGIFCPSGVEISKIGSIRPRHRGCDNIHSGHQPSPSRPVFPNGGWADVFLWCRAAPRHRGRGLQA